MVNITIIIQRSVFFSVFHHLPVLPAPRRGTESDEDANTECNAYVPGLTQQLRRSVQQPQVHQAETGRAGEH